MTQRIDDQASWIGLERADRPERPCPYLRRSFRLSTAPRRAVLQWTALGTAEISINGHRVDDGHLMPGWSDYRLRTQVMTTDVTDLLGEDANCIGAILADGWYSGSLLWFGERNHYGKDPCFLAVLKVELDNGESVAIATDDTWRGRFGPILGSDPYHGETYDARAELEGWSEPGGTVGSWRKVRLFPQYPGVLEPKRCEPARVTEALKPGRPRKLREGCWVFDFKQNFAGVCRLQIRGRRGQKVLLRFGEMVNPDGSVYRENLRSARATDTYLCKGEGLEAWTPRFTFHGFRYVEVEGLEERPQASMLTGQVLHTDMRPTGRFECSNPDINRLHENIRWGMRSNFLDVPTDCPQRDERLGWTGDAQVFVGTAGFLYDVRHFFEKWMRDLVDGQSPEGAFPDVAPDVLGAHVPHSPGNAAWADAGVICPWVVYQLYGDATILGENYAAMVRWIDFQERTSDQLRRPPTVYGDWLAIDAVEPEHAPVPSDLVGTAYFAHTADLMSRVAQVLGRKADAARFRKLRTGIVRAFRREYVSPGGRVVGDCQTGYLLALAFDLLPNSQRPRAVERLVELIACRDWHLTTGFVGTPLLCPVLTRFGRTDVAYKLLMQDTYPSWLYPIRNGATTMWERWNSYTRERGFGPVDMNSFNHYAYGAVGEWMYAVVGGIRRRAPGFSEILIAPEPGGDITSARTELDTPAGRIACEWSLTGDKLRITAEIPEKTIARLQLPPGYKTIAPAPELLPAGCSQTEAVAAK